MKTAISLPDALGYAADRYASLREMSRSELYARALSEYLERHKYDDVTEKIDAAMLKIDNSEPKVSEFGISSIRELEW